MRAGLTLEGAAAADVVFFSDAGKITGAFRLHLFYPSSWQNRSGGHNTRASLASRWYLATRGQPPTVGSRIVSTTPRRATMVRGNAKALAQAKNLAKKDSQKQAKSDLKLRGAALKTSCPICKANMINHHQLKAHYDSKHPKDTCPPPPEE